VSFSTHVTIFSDDIVGWRSGDQVWTVSGEVPLLTIGCPGVYAQVFAQAVGKAFPVAHFVQALDPANTAFAVVTAE